MNKSTVRIVEIIGSIIVLSALTGSAMVWWRSRKYCDGQNQTTTAEPNVDNLILNEADMRQFSLDYCDQMRKDWDSTYASWQTKFSDMQLLLDQIHTSEIRDGSWSNEGWRQQNMSYSECKTKNMDKFGGNYGPMPHVVNAADANLTAWRTALVNLDTMIKSKKPLCNVQIKK